ncbi:MAG TPA: hypothetical protein PLE45_09335 [Spirochaetota bacterium]|nr:hypothetical protein [Spirochaetota bacterium]HOL57326.1 hypothetical protein [Spirochaetota bacterium]HPP04889.1 hypothetical protein [Spirochaetota bacterium]
MYFNTINEIKELKLEEFNNIIVEILNNKNIPEINFFKSVTKLAIFTLQNENENIRPKDKNNLPGGIINLTEFDKVIILPDLHARRFFLKKVLNFKKRLEKVLLEELEYSNISLLCLGDGVHGEANFASRWLKAYEEFKRNFEPSPNMDMEIADSFNLMLAVMLLKIRYPEKFHFLKGNHENIYNETGNGNYAFAKYANEGFMVLLYFKKKYDDEILSLYSQFEKNLPIFVVGRNFLASHAEPMMFVPYDKIVNYREYPEIIESFTWTDNYSSVKGTIDSFLDYYIPQNDQFTYYFGGHRPIKDRYFLINGDRYVQIHNPQKEIIAFIDQNKKIDLESDIIEI